VKLESKPNSRLKRFYYLSLLCAFPGFGIFIGIVLLFYAVFVFKSIKLFCTIVLTMAIGIVLIKLDSYYLRRELMYGSATENLLALQALDDLDDIARNLELYKLKYQHYPDSLRELKKENPTLVLKDPLLGRRPSANKFINFYYSRNGDTYNLFSAGKDGLPNTSDDIYPRKPLK
jgi:hypothetical protein